MRFTDGNSLSPAVLYAFPRCFADNPPAAAKVPSYPKNTSDKMPAAAEVPLFRFCPAVTPPDTAAILPSRLLLPSSSASSADLSPSLDCSTGELSADG